MYIYIYIYTYMYIYIHIYIYVYILFIYIYTDRRQHPARTSGTATRHLEKENPATVAITAGAAWYTV